MALHHFADAGNLANVEGSEEFRFFSGDDPQHAIGLGLRGRNFRNQTRRSDADRTIQLRFFLHPLVQLVRSFQRRTVQPRRARHVEVGLVDRSHLDLRRECRQHFIDFFGTLAVALGMPVDKDGIRTKLRRSSQRQRRMHPKLPRLIRCRRHHPALVALSTDDDGFAFQRGIVEFFHRHEEGVHIDVEDGAGESRQLRCDGHERIVPAAFGALSRSGLSSRPNGCHPDRSEGLQGLGGFSRPAPSPALAPPPASASPAHKPSRTRALKRSRKNLCSCHYA